jgi:RNA polymerase sigma-70 factor (ECF subfamily)
VLTGHNRPARISRDPLGVRPTQRGARRPVDPAATRTPGPVNIGNVAFRAPAPPIPEPFSDDDALVAALRRGDGHARMVLVERFEPLVERLVAGALGIDSEIPDVVQDVFVAVLEGVHKLKDATALRSWIATLAVFTARGRIRRRRRWRWIRFVAPEEVPEVPVSGPQGETHEAVRATYAVLDSFPADERLAFSLRFVSEMQLTEVADACRVSLATVKRRLARAEKRFLEAANTHPALRERLTRGNRWGEEET